MKTVSKNSLFQSIGITKSFPGVRANENISLSVKESQIHALLGENGAGKSTLVKIFYGLLQPDKGEMILKGSKYSPKNPKNARSSGIGMVFQHFSLFEPLTVLENILLGLDQGANKHEIGLKVSELSKTYGLETNLSSFIGDLSAGERQRVEIIRALLQEPNLLIMDEPTSVLTPFEANNLFSTLKKLSDDGTSILYISHKLQEIADLCDTATVLRKGEVIGEYDPKTISPKELGEIMVGQPLTTPNRPKKNKKQKALFSFKAKKVEPDTQFGMTLKDIDFQVNESEILGIGGVAGNGQEELMQLLIGEKRKDTVFIEFRGDDISKLNPRKRRGLGIAFAPEERLGHAAVANLSLLENSLITDPKNRFSDYLGFINFENLQSYTTSVIEKFNVKTTGFKASAGSLSGGNLQKFVVGREIEQSPVLFIVNQPTWGVDALSASNIRESIVEITNAGAGVILISQDLDELLEITNRIAFLSEGTLSKPIETSNAVVSDIGAIMGGLVEKETE